MNTKYLNVIMCSCILLSSSAYAIGDNQFAGDPYKGGSPFEGKPNGGRPKGKNRPATKDTLPQDNSKKTEAVTPPAEDTNKPNVIDKSEQPPITTPPAENQDKSAQTEAPKSYFSRATDALWNNKGKTIIGLVVVLACLGYKNSKPTK